MFAIGEGGLGGADREFGVVRCKLLHLEHMGNKVLLYIAQGTVSRLLGKKLMEKEKKKAMYGWLGHFAVQQKLKEHCKSTIL